MLERYTHENMRDFGPRYVDTYGFLLKNNGSKKLIYITENTRDAVYFRTEEAGMLYHANIDSHIEFEFIQVDRGFFTADDGCVYLLTRVPARQWKRGIGRNNTSVMQLTSVGLMPIKLSLPLLNSIFSVEIGYSWEYVKEGQQQMALSRHFAMNDRDLFFYETPIGKVDHTSHVITVNGSYSVTQELNDAIRRNGFPYSVKEQND